MSPLYRYRCECGHESERLVRYEDREKARRCPLCGEAAEYVLSAHHTQPDGIYSHEPNIGDAKAFERKNEEAKRWVR